MKATPIAEFLARKSETRAAVESPAPPRRGPVANDDREPDFRRSGLVAALARRSAEPALVRPLDPAAFAPRREPPPLRYPAPAPEPQVDWEERLAESYHRGVQEGLDAGKAEAATARALERAEWQKRAVVEKLDFQMNEFARLSETLTQTFAELERRIAEAAARALKPLVQDRVAKQIVDELVDNVARLTRGGGLELIKIRGSAKLLSALKEKIAALAIAVEYVEEEGVEITVSAQATEIRSELQPWARLIDDIVGRD
jgi:flagellar biosynthesis/type III secretory pathway protein FliH